jgi:hypothetical protein
MVLCGAILEALLLDALRRRHAPAESGTGDLAELIEDARRRGILSAPLPVGPALRAFRQLVHPGFPDAQRLVATRDEAEAALHAVRMCLRQITAARGG